MTKKLYINNPYLKESQALITDKSFDGDKYLIKLDKTIFFPNLSGGQPKDLGTISGKEVLDVYEDKDDIVHVVGEEIGSKNVSLSIDWDNRFDLMQQHTGQHVLSASIKSLLNAKTVGFHIGDKYLTIDIDLSHISKANINQIEFLANKMIQSNFKIKSKILYSADLDKVDISKVPKDNEKIRIVSIEGISSSACSGTHVSSTGEIGLIKIINTDKYKGKTRITFLCGNRALKDYSLKHDSAKSIALSLSANADDLLEKFIKFKEEKDFLQKSNRDLRNELTCLKGDKLLENKKTFRNIDYIIEDLGDIDKSELNLISSYLNKKENLIQIFKLQSENHGMFLIAKSQNLSIDLKEVFDTISKKIIVQGGGNKDRIQGTTSLIIIDKVLEMLYREIRKYFGD